MATPKETPIVSSNAADSTSISHSSADNRSADMEEKAAGEHVEHLETIHTNERVPGHPGYYEKDGLRTYGDGQDHDHEPPVRTVNFKPAIELTKPFADDDPPLHEFTSYGFPLDWLPDPAVSVWCHPTNHLW